MASTSVARLPAIAFEADGGRDSNASVMCETLPRHAATFTQGLTETKEQQKQRQLGERTRGGPKEHVISEPLRLSRTRECELSHSFMEEPLTRYKRLEPSRPHWPKHFRRFHLMDGIRVLDQDTVIVSARDRIHKTKRGQLRDSSGSITYSASHRLKVELDVENLANIARQHPPGGAHDWTLAKLEWVFTERTGRRGSWAHYEVPFRSFLALFPKTFEFVGDKFVRLRHKSVCRILDKPEDAMIRLAKGRHSGVLEPVHVVGHEQVEAMVHDMCPELSRAPTAPSLQLQRHRLKVAYTPHVPGSAPARSRSSGGL
mmetsp:Transcript_15535/g.35556  ORF Transcript_15535/g.35556 Transcript_15535/m.35556 type:complete len:315 (-) Transcript_15535:51-995(-)